MLLLVRDGTATSDLELRFLSLSGCFAGVLDRLPPPLPINMYWRPVSISVLQNFRITTTRLICGIFVSFKLHGCRLPISMKSHVIRQRAREDARRGDSGNAGHGSGQL